MTKNRINAKPTRHPSGLCFSVIFSTVIIVSLVTSVNLWSAQNTLPQHPTQSDFVDRQTDSQSLKRDLPAITWDIEWAITRDRPGYPLLANVEHFKIQKPLLESGVYHHHPQIVVHKGRFFVSWSNHPFGEDGPGQKVLWAVSDDGKTWSNSRVLFAGIDNVKVSTANGRNLIASPFIQFEGRLFGVAIANEGVGFGSMNTPVDGEPLSKQKTEEFRKRIRRGLGTIVREIKDDLTLGKTFWIGKKKPQPQAGFHQFLTAAELGDESISAEFALKIARLLSDPIRLSPWDFCSPETETVAKNGSRLCEPTTFATDDGELVRFMRDLNGSQKLFAQFSFDDGQSWSAGVPTPIPDAPSKTCVGRLPNGNYFLIGNQVVSKRGTRRDPLTIGLSSDGVTFKTAFAIRWRAPKLQIPSQQQGKDGRGRGFQYPSFAVAEGSLWVVYSVNKEAIDVSRIPLAELAIDSAKG